MQLMHAIGWLFSVLLQVSPAGPLAPAATPFADGDDLVAGRFGPATVHRVMLEAGDDRAAALRRSGAVSFEHDYGAFTLFLVHEGAYGGRARLAASGLPFRDEQDLIPVNGRVLDGRRPADLLGRLLPDERLGGVPGRLDPTAGLYLVQFVGPPDDAWLERLAATGVRRVQYQPMNAYVVSAGPAAVARLERFAETDAAVQYAGEWQPGFRMTPTIRWEAANARGQSRRVTVQVVDGPDSRRVVQTIEGLAGGANQVWRVGPYVNIDVVLDPTVFAALSRLPSVFAIEPRGVPGRKDERQGSTVAGNVHSTGPNDTDYLGWLASMGFDSSQFGSFSVNVVDDATTINGHPDLPFGRIDFQINPTSQTGGEAGHGFINAHIIGGFNNLTGSTYNDTAGYNYGLGIAPFAHLGSTAIFGPGFSTASNWENTAYSNGARISSNSWSFIDGAENPIPDYDSSSQEYDSLVRDARSGVSGNQEYMIIFSAGNDGPSGNTISTPSTAKNIVTVAAGENNRQQGTDGCGVTNSGANDINDIIDFSSQGPVDSSGGDGRWKPEISAPGTHIQGGIPQSNYIGGGTCNMFWPIGSTLYGWSSGTSHSAPAIAGGAALIRQWFLNQSLPAPSPALNKALILNTAEYMTGAFAGDTLPSESQGMGLMDLGRAFDGVPKLFEDQGVVLGSTGASHVVNGNVAVAGQPFRVSLVWTDAPGSTSGAPWVNDLDLQVAVGGSVYRGNVFSGANSVTGGSFDFRNNSESVFVPAGVTGSFTVTVTAASIAGNGLPGNADSTDQDFALVIYNGQTGGGPVTPTANFTGTPLAGIVPLNVNFTDASIGDVDTWAWTFGDGGTSTAENPSHQYTSVGSYAVSLTVTGPGGSDGETKNGYITVNAAPTPGISDGSFESQSAGTTPTTPWSVTFGSGHVVNPSGISSDNGMPSDGSQWAELSGESTNNATPPSNPGGVTNPPVGGAGIEQDFTYPAGQTELSFEASFLRNEDPSSQYNDWMSVDVTDGATTVNVYYKDTFSSTSGTSAKYGYAMTPVETVTVDLATLFPSSSTSTLFTLTAQVGNGFDDFQRSLGYIDDVRFSGAVAAPVAEFSGTPLTGAAPLNVSFTDLSSGSVTSWSWTFGDGGTSTAQNPSYNYTSAGIYNVSLTATGPGGSDGETKNGYVVVSVPPPVAEFSGTPLTGAAPLNVDFTDLSSGSVTSWSWTFGDGGTSTAQNPSYNYTSAGIYNVSLTATGPGGSDGETKNGYVVVSVPPPVAEFGGTPTSGTHPLNVDFADLSSGSVTSWSWTFGDGGTSTAQNPSHLYTAAGSYDVTLTVTGPGGSDPETKSAYISVSDPAPVAEFSGTPLTGVAPLNVDFTDLSTGPVTSWSWTFGDGGTSTAQNPSYNYTSAGIYNVSLTATGPGGSDGETKNGYVVVSVPPPVAEFSGTPLTGVAPLNVDFTDLSSGSVTSWSWTFGDGGTSTAQNPSYNYTSAGIYNVSLTATGPGGSDGETKNGYVVVSVPPPVAEFSGTPTSGTHPLNVDFTDLSSGSVTSWSWTFGDGGTSTAQNPSHLYTAAGSYDVTLTVTGPGGSDPETKSAYISVSEPAPVAEFSGTPTSGIVPLNVAFTDLSTGPVTSWSWTFGDGATSTAQNPSHLYTAAGMYDVTLTATGPGGVDAESKTNYIVVSVPPPVAGFGATPTSGILPLDVDFTDASTGSILSWSWTFGDGGTSTAQNPSHTYTAAGTYDVTLTVTGPGGADGETQLGLIAVSEPAPVAEFSGTPTSGVSPLEVDFTDLSSGPVTSWAWTFGDGGTSTAQSPSHTYSAAGSYEVTLTATGPGGSDGETKAAYITVAEPAPVASFTSGASVGVTPLTVAYTDTSTGPITAWSWSFGDGGASVAQHPSYEYTVPGTYDVVLTVTGPGGVDVATQVGLVTIFADPWEDLGFGLAGTGGTPLLEGLGPLVAGQPMTIELSGAQPSAPAVLFYGFSRLDAPLYGGTLVPDFSPPGNLLTVITGPSGSLSLGTTWPAGLPAGTELFIQYWMPDAGGPFGFASSNAVKATTP